MKLSTIVRTVIIGDSMFWSGSPFFGGQPSPLAKWLETWSSHHPIENHALVGASLEDGWVKSIEAQYDDLRKQSNITTLIMDGGGNDVISHRRDCEAWNDACRDTVDRSLGIAKGVLEKAYADGVQHVVYLGFYHLKGLEDAADYADTTMALICDEAPVECHFVDPRYNATTGTGLQTPEMLGDDGLHPTPEGYKILAQLVWDTAIQYNITL